LTGEPKGGKGAKESHKKVRHQGRASTGDTESVSGGRHFQQEKRCPPKKYMGNSTK